MALVVLGGLGGGGDIGLAIILEHLLEGVETVYVSFAGCRPSTYPGHRVAGSLFVPIRHHPRDFEWSLKKLRPDAAVYRLCVKAERSLVEEALEWLDRAYRPECTLHTDIGGDGALTGYEKDLGSYITDTLARAALLWAHEMLGWRSLLAIGGLQLEGGRRRFLNLEELVADLLYYEEKGALLGVIDPPPGTVQRAKAILYPGREMVSVMLPLYLAALEGKTAVTISKGYSTGLHRIDWWARYVFLLDNAKACRASPLCMAAREKWIQGISRWSPPAPPRNYTWALRRARKNPEQALRKLIRRYGDHSPSISSLCAGRQGYS